MIWHIHKHSLKETDCIVNEKTRQAVDPPARNVLETGFVFRLVDHSLFAKVGTLRIIDEGAAHW